MRKFLFLVLFFLLFLSSCRGNTLDFNIESSTKISIFSGSSGKRVDVKDEETITKITAIFNDLTYEKFKYNDYDGFLYSISWYKNDKKIKTIGVMNDSRIIYKDYLYDINCEGKLDLEYFESLLPKYNEIYDAGDIKYYKFGYSKLETNKIIRSKEELLSFEKDYSENSYNFSNYDETYFIDNSLIIVSQTENSGSNSITVKSINSFDDEMIVVFDEKTPQNGTCDMAYWVIIIEAKKADIKNITNVKTTIE